MLERFGDFPRQDSLWPLLTVSDSIFNQVIDTTERIFSRISEWQCVDHSSNPLTYSQQILADAYLHKGHGRILELLSKSLMKGNIASDILSLLRNRLNERIPPNRLLDSLDSFRKHAWELMTIICKYATQLWFESRGLRSQIPTEQISTEVIEFQQRLFHLLDYAALTLQAASGALHKRNTATEVKSPATREHERAFLASARMSIQYLGSVGEPKVVHHIVEMLRSCIDSDPPLVFDLVAKILGTAIEKGYQYESMAVGVVVQIIERYLADYPTLLQQSSNQEALLRILDAFIEWPNARKLTYRLSDVYR